jgi:hypothetical protein
VRVGHEHLCTVHLAGGAGRAWCRLSGTPGQPLGPLTRRPRNPADDLEDPRQGAQSHSEAVGFGHVRPAQIAFAGDGTSYINHVRWSSWGGSRAVGHGVANWAFPGWDDGSATPVKAEVVAYGLGSRDRQRAYQHVTWFWPPRGDHFTPSLFRTSGPEKFPPYHQPRIQHCAAVQILSLARSADQITRFAFQATAG